MPLSSETTRDVPSQTVQDQLKWFEQMVVIRRFEESAIELFGKGLISGSTHPCIGQEAIAVGVCAALEPNDLVLATYRGHGVCIAKGSDIGPLMAELLGRSTGCCKGKGGSMHLCDVSHGILGTNAIVAAHIPIAGGVALASKLRKTGQVTACFFGDGAACEGEFFETLNMAALWKVPLILICENNGYAISVETAKSQATLDIADRAKGFGIPGEIVDGNNVIDVRRVALAAAARAREGLGPSLIECKTVRWERHSAFSAGRYVNPEAAQKWRSVDPIPRLRRSLLEAGATDEMLRACEEKARAAVATAVNFAMESPRPEYQTVFEDVFEV